VGEPIVSVVICVYNAGSYLRPAVASILAQTYTNLEILIINDGSTDGCMDSIAEVNDPRVRILNQENRGRPATLNRALDEAKGEFYVIQDADDLSHPSRIQRLVECMLANPDVAGVFSGHEIVLNSRHIAPRLARKDPDECKRCIDQFVMPAHDPTGMFRMAMVGRMRYDTSLPYTEAVDYIFRVGEQFPLMVLGECLYSYRIHLGSITKRDPTVRQRFVRECLRRACERRGIDPEPILNQRLDATRGKNELADNNLAAEFMESVLDQRRAGRRLSAVRTGMQCSRLHPLDLHYQKALIYAAAPMWMVKRLRRHAI
jgi:glycosyltransferase involved in cell wall biosynthesis